jgi:hypothetical protein
MLSSIAMIAAAVLLTAVPAAAAPADGPPKLDVTAGCVAAARGPVLVVRDKAVCLGEERAAEGILVKNWPAYDAADRTQCSGHVTTGGPASYVELLSCLEMMRDVRKIREAEQGAPEEKPTAPAPVKRRRKRAADGDDF